MEIHGHGHGRGASLRLVSYVLFTGCLGLLLPRTGLAQVTFASQATASYNLQGQTVQSGHTQVNYYELQSLSTNNPYANPVLLSKSIGGTLGSGAASSSLFINASAQGSAGLMRASMNGSASAAWTRASSSSSGQSDSSVTVRWTDAYIMSGDPANPQPGRPLMVAAFLNLTGGIDHDLTAPTAYYGSSAPGVSNIRLSLGLTGRDQLGRNLFPTAAPYSGGAYAVENDSTNPNSFITPFHGPPPGTVPILLTAIEGQTTSMTFEMRIRAIVQSSNGSEYRGDDATSLSFDADFGRTLTWGGITAVTDAATGTAVSGWSITSASGVNYANAIPEPASLALLVLGAVGLARRARSGARVWLVDLDWTAPVDDGDSDPDNLAAASYDLRFSTQPITDANWDAATPVANLEPTPQDAGLAETAYATELSPSTTYYFAMRSTDEAGNSSGLSNIVSATTMATDTMHISGLGVALSFPGGWQRRPMASVAVADSAGYPVIGVTVSGYWTGPLKGTNTTGSGVTVLTGYGYAAARIEHPKSFNCPRRGGYVYFTADNVVDSTGVYTWDGVERTAGTGCY